MDRLRLGNDHAPRTSDGAGASAPVPTGEAPRTVVVTPEEVWSAPRSGPPSPPAHDPPHQTFWAPLVLVVAVSSALMALALAALLLLLWLHR